MFILLLIGFFVFLISGSIMMFEGKYLIGSIFLFLSFLCALIMFKRRRKKKKDNECDWLCFDAVCDFCPLDGDLCLLDCDVCGCDLT